MREYNSINLKGDEAQTLYDLSQALEENFEPIPFPGDFDSAMEELDWNTELAFWHEANHVVGLLIGSSDLTSLPESLGNLSELKFINCQETHFQSFPESIKNLKKIEIIQVAYNEESNPETSLEFPDVFHHLQNLQKFIVYGHYEIYIPPSFTKLQNLKEINLEFCTIFTNHSNFIKYAKNSKKLAFIKPIMKFPLNLDSIKTLEKKSLVHIYKFDYQITRKKFNSNVKQVNVKHPVLKNIRKFLRESICQAVEQEKNRILDKRLKEKDYYKSQMLWAQHEYLVYKLLKFSICKCNNWGCETIEGDMAYIPALDSSKRGWYCKKCYLRNLKYQDFHYFDSDELGYQKVFLKGGKTFIEITGCETWWKVGETYEIAPPDLESIISDNLVIQERENSVYIFVNNNLLHNYWNYSFYELESKLSLWVKNDYMSDDLDPRLVSILLEALLGNDLQLINQYIKEGENEKAIDSLLDLLKSKPNSIPILTKLGSLYFDMKNYEKSIEYLENALKQEENPRFPHSASTLEKLGFAYYEINDNLKAVENLEKCIVQRSPNLQYRKQWDILLNIYDKMDAEDKIIEIYKKRNNMYEKKYKDLTLERIYYHYSNLNKHDKIKNLFSQLIKSDLERWKKLARFYFHNARSDITIKYHEKILELEPNNLRSLKRLADLMVSSLDLKKAQVYCKRILKLRPNDYEALYILGCWYIEKLEYGKAINCLKKSFLISPFYNDSIQLLEKLFIKEKIKDGKINFLEEVIDKHPQHEKLMRLLGNLYISKEDHVKAIEIHQKLVNILYIDKIPILTILGKLYISNGDEEKSISVFNKVKRLLFKQLKQSKNNKYNLIKYYENLGEIYTLLKEYDNALEVYNKLLNLEPDNKEIQRKKQFLRLEMNNFKNSNN